MQQTKEKKIADLDDPSVTDKGICAFQIAVQPGWTEAVQKAHAACNVHCKAQPLDMINVNSRIVQYLQAQTNGR